MGKAARLFITLPAEVWAIALKSLVFRDRSEEDFAKKETTCPEMTVHKL
jgi:hypothetical protein